MELQEEQVWDWKRDQKFSFKHVKILADIQVKTLNRQLVIEISRKIKFGEIYLGIGNINIV